jgi:ornithine cyclodeaminase
MQVSFLQAVTDCRKVHAWGRTPEHAALYRQDLQDEGFEVVLEETLARVAAAANLIVSTTPSSTPLLQAGDVRPGTLITAVGSDTPGKQELDPGILGKADVLVADSLSQCRERGEISRALAAGAIAEEGILELGRIIQEPGLAVLGEDSLCVVDLTGVAVQDVQIASAVCAALDV